MKRAFVAALGEAWALHPMKVLRYNMVAAAISIDLPKYLIERSVLQLVSRAFCVQHRLIPVVTVEGALVVAMSDPSDAIALAELQILTGRKIEAVRAEPSKVGEAIVRYYGSPDS